MEPPALVQPWAQSTCLCAPSLALSRLGATGEQAWAQSGQLGPRTSIRGPELPAWVILEESFHGHRWPPCLLRGTPQGPSVPLGTLTPGSPAAADQVLAGDCSSAGLMPPPALSGWDPGPTHTEMLGPSLSCPHCPLEPTPDVPPGSGESYVRPSGCAPALPTEL